MPWAAMSSFGLLFLVKACIAASVPGWLRETMGVSDPMKKYDMHELASGDVIVCATGVTDGAMLKGVKFGKEMIETETVIYRSVTGTVRRIHAEHREMAKFRLD